MLGKSDLRCITPERKVEIFSLTFASRSFYFKNGDVLMFKDEGANGVIHIESITYQCTGAKCTPIRIVMNINIGPNQMHLSLPDRIADSLCIFIYVCKQMLV